MCILFVSHVIEDAICVEQLRPADKIRICLELLESHFAVCHFLFYVTLLKEAIAKHLLAR